MGNAQQFFVAICLIITIMLTFASGKCQLMSPKFTYLLRNGTYSSATRRQIGYIGDQSMHSPFYGKAAINVKKTKKKNKKKELSIKSGYTIKRVLWLSWDHHLKHVRSVQVYPTNART